MSSNDEKITILQGLITLLSTFTGLYLGYVIQQANSAIELANDLKFQYSGYRPLQEYLRQHLNATYDLSTWLLIAAASGVILLAITTIVIFWQKNKILKFNSNPFSILLLVLFLSSWIFQPVLSTIMTWREPEWNIPNDVSSSIPSSDFLPIKSKIVKLGYLRYFGKSFLKTIANTGLLFFLWLSSLLTINAHEYTKRNLLKTMILSIPFAIIPFYVYGILQKSINNILMFPAIKAWLSGETGILHPDSSITILSRFGHHFWFETMPKYYNIIFKDYLLHIWAISIGYYLVIYVHENSFLNRIWRKK